MQKPNRIYFKFFRQELAIDPIEFFIWFMVGGLVGITISDRIAGRLEYQEAMARVRDITVFIFGVRVAPTGKISDWAESKNLFGSKKSEDEND